MATITNRNGKWFCQIRRKGFATISKTFSTKQEAESFADMQEEKIRDEISKFSVSPSAYKLPVTNFELMKIYKTSKKSAAARNIEHNLTPKEFLELFESQNGQCAVSGLHFSGGKADEWRVRPFFPSLDRIDSIKGYEKQNVRFVLTAVNIALSDWGDGVLTTIAFGITRLAIEKHINGINKETRDIMVLPN